VAEQAAALDPGLVIEASGVVACGTPAAIPGKTVSSRCSRGLSESRGPLIAGDGVGLRCKHNPEKVRPHPTWRGFAEFRTWLEEASLLLPAQYSDRPTGRELQSAFSPPRSQNEANFGQFFQIQPQ